jgi:anti-sigma B factor antagonist
MYAGGQRLEDLAVGRDPAWLCNMRASAVAGAYVTMSLRDGYVVIALRGELDVCTTASVMPAFMAPAESGAGIIVDLADLAFMDCSSLRELASARAQARLAGGDLMLACPQPIVVRLLFLTDVINHWPEFASVDEAVSGAGGAPSICLAREATAGVD